MFCSHLLLFPQWVELLQKSLQLATLLRFASLSEQSSFQGGKEKNQNETFEMRVFLLPESFTCIGSLDFTTKTWRHCDAIVCHVFLQQLFINYEGRNNECDYVISTAKL